MAVAFAPLAAAEADGGADPTLNDSDLDNSSPDEDTSYLNDSEEMPADNASEPELHAEDLDTSPPQMDTSYLTDEEGTDGAQQPPPEDGSGSSSAATPFPGLVALVAAGAVAAFAARRR